MSIGYLHVRVCVQEDTKCFLKMIMNDESLESFVCQSTRCYYTLLFVNRLSAMRLFSLFEKVKKQKYKVSQITPMTLEVLVINWSISVFVLLAVKNLLRNFAVAWSALCLKKATSTRHSNVFYIHMMNFCFESVLGPFKKRNSLASRYLAKKVSIPRQITEAPNVNFRKISVRKTIWDLEFSEHFL